MRVDLNCNLDKMAYGMVLYGKTFNNTINNIDSSILLRLRICKGLFDMVGYYRLS